eukprot:TRINITY_DN1303_c0_g1_i1.p1 TRINITY_DN1303_c0_g1~~TRINITY_DN1303_c0_g1_i1.p1  ORF type:complete len:374 (-),score=75.77 TRINITY_DN1303_c0_g1_i1:83-1204(-)
MTQTDIHPPNQSCGFEGPEKRLQVTLKVRNPLDPVGSLRSISQERWQTLLDLAGCTIISAMSNSSFDSYVLSESSLFVWPTRVMLKTCGTIILFNVIPLLLDYASDLNLEFQEIVYSRKNYIFPQAQPHPHSHWDHEVDLLNLSFPGKSFTFGCASGDHWRVFIANNESTDAGESEIASAPDQSQDDEILVEIMMQELSPNATKKFYMKPGTQDKDKFPGIAELVPGSMTDEFNFNPCGYSMNGLNEEAHWTIHVTPEDHCSYASFETNWRDLTRSPATFSLLMDNLKDIFCPAWVMIAVRKTGSYRAQHFDASSIELDLPGYILQEKNFAPLSSNHSATCYVFRSEETSPKPRKMSHVERCFRSHLVLDGDV